MKQQSAIVSCWQSSSTTNSQPLFIINHHLTSDYPALVVHYYQWLDFLMATTPQVPSLSQGATRATWRRTWDITSKAATWGPTPWCPTKPWALACSRWLLGPTRRGGLLGGPQTHVLGLIGQRLIGLSGLRVSCAVWLHEASSWYHQRISTSAFLISTCYMSVRCGLLCRRKSRLATDDESWWSAGRVIVRLAYNHHSESLLVMTE